MITPKPPLIEHPVILSMLSEWQRFRDMHRSTYAELCKRGKEEEMDSYCYANAYGGCIDDLKKALKEIDIRSVK